MLFVLVLFLGVLWGGVSQAQAALPSNEQWRLALVDTCMGWACAGLQAIDYSTWSLCTVSNLNDSGTGSLRACVTGTTPRWIVFSVSGTITLTSGLQVPSNKVVDGRGADITLTTAGSFSSGDSIFTVGTTTTSNPASNVILENLKFADCLGFMIVITEEASTIWVDHVTLGQAADDRLYVGGGSPLVTGVAAQNVTISWIKSLAKTGTWGDKTLLVSTGDVSSFDADTTLTLHHNWYQTTARVPFGAWAKIHAFNNYYDKTDDGAQLYSHAQFYSENDIFEARFSGAWAISWSAGPEPFADNLRLQNPYFIGTLNYEERNAGTIFTPSTFYSYTAVTANEALRTAIMAGAGWQSVSAPATDPVAYYALDGTAQDSSGNALHGTLIGSPTYTTGRVGQGLSLNGTSQSVDVADAALLDLTSTYTLAAFVKPSTALTDFHAVLVKNYTYVLYASTTGICGSGAPYGATSGGGAVCQATPLTANVWTHLAVTFDGTTLRLYRDGAEVATDTNSTSPTATTGTLQLGSSEFNEYFPGVLDEVYVYARALSSTEVADLAAQGAATPTPAPLVLRLVR